MKTFLLIRHAKSSWDNIIISDFERPLSDRGKQDAPKMAKRLEERKIKIDCFVSSPAKRAKKTAKIFMQTYNENLKNLILIPSLYEASVKDFYNAVENFDDSCNSVAVFSHNPGITDFANTLSDYTIDNMPTCSVFAISIKIKKWIDFKQTTKEMLFFDLPKHS